jgi:hypothetical protein
MKSYPQPEELKILGWQDLGQEILLYDLTIDKAFCRPETASHVFRKRFKSA